MRTQFITGVVLAMAGLACIAARAQSVTGGMERAVTGVPFTAESVTEYFQTASDGSHVKQSTTSRVARDSSGRTRYSQTLLPLLPGGPKVITIIRDPVAEIRYYLDDQDKTVRSERIPAAKGKQPQIPAPQEAAVQVARQSVKRVLAAHMGDDAAWNTQTNVESGRTHNLEGSIVVGAKVTAVITAGQIGNEKSLTVSSEAWYSSDLGIIMLSKVHDPLLGDTLFQVKNVQRGEPNASEFAVPPGYHSPSKK
jgi:hypothetical protein